MKILNKEGNHHKIYDVELEPIGRKHDTPRNTYYKPVYSDITFFVSGLDEEEKHIYN